MVSVISAYQCGLCDKRSSDRLKIERHVLELGTETRPFLYNVGEEVWNAWPQVGSSRETFLVRITRRYVGRHDHGNSYDAVPIQENILKIYNRKNWIGLSEEELSREKSVK